MVVIGLGVPDVTRLRAALNPHPPFRESPESRVEGVGFGLRVWFQGVGLWFKSARRFKSDRWAYPKP